MTELVTGAPGWLGTEVVRRLHKRGQHARCLTLEGVDTSPLEPFDVSVYEGDVREPASLDDAFEGGVDTVFHCAGMIHPPKLFGAHLFEEINADGTRNMLEAARQHGCEHFVYISSNAAQGFSDDQDAPMREDQEPEPEPESAYGRSKLAAEEHVRDYHDDYGIDSTIVRPCWYYGPRQPDRMATLMRMIQEGDPIVFGDGENHRSMTYIPALVDALMLVDDHRSTANGETYWITDETPYTTNHVYETIADLLGVEDLDPTYVPTPISRLMEKADILADKLGVYQKHIHVAGEMSRGIAADPTKASEELGYEPPSSLREGMREAVEWAKRNSQL